MLYYPRKAVWIFLTCMLIATGAAAQTAAPTSFDPIGVKAKYRIESGTISYQLVHKLHNVTGTSKQVSGIARFLNNGTVQVQINSPVASFDSGNSNRDAHMKETTEAAKYPNVEVKASTQGFTLPTEFPANSGKEAFGKASVLFHGQSHEISLTTLSIAFSDDSTIRLTGSFPISLTAFGVERPSLLFVKVDNEVKISFDITFKKS